MKKKNTPEIVLSRYKEDNYGCWIWTGHQDGRNYGQLTIDSKTYRAHRISYELVNGAIPKGLVIDHLCRNTLCINPNHLEAVTASENSIRMHKAKVKGHCKGCNCVDD